MLAYKNSGNINNLCNSPGCKEVAKLRCPQCIKLNIHNESYFCGKECFSIYWPIHQLIHGETNVDVNTYTDDEKLIIQLLCDQIEQDQIDFSMPSKSFSSFYLLFIQYFTSLLIQYKIKNEIWNSHFYNFYYKFYSWNLVNYDDLRKNLRQSNIINDILLDASKFLDKNAMMNLIVGKDNDAFNDPFNFTFQISKTLYEVIKLRINVTDKVLVEELINKIDEKDNKMCFERLIEESANFNN